MSGPFQSCSVKQNLMISLFKTFSLRFGKFQSLYFLSSIVYFKINVIFKVKSSHIWLMLSKKQFQSWRWTSTAKKMMTTFLHRLVNLKVMNFKFDFYWLQIEQLLIHQKVRLAFDLKVPLWIRGSLKNSESNHCHWALLFRFLTIIIMYLMNVFLR